MVFASIAEDEVAAGRCRIPRVVDEPVGAMATEEFRFEIDGLGSFFSRPRLQLRNRGSSRRVVLVENVVVRGPVGVTQVCSQCKWRSVAKNVSSRCPHTGGR